MKKSIIYIYSITLFIASCSNPSMEDSTSSNTNIMGTSSLNISAEQFKANEMTLISPATVPFYATVKVTGKVCVPPENRASISTYYEGYVKNIKLLEGEYVKKGQRLFTLQNPEFLEMQQDFLEAKAQLEYLRSEYERQELLAKENIASQKNYLKAKSQYGITNTRYESLKKKLSLLGINASALSNSNLRSSIAILAPISGNVSGLNVSQGKVLSPSEVALTITNSSSIYAEMMVFEQDILRIKKGQKVNYLITGSKEKAGGKIHLVSKAITEGENAVTVIGDFEDSLNKKDIYPGMYVQAEIVTHSESKLGIPEESVIELDGKFYVLKFLKKAPHEYSFSKEEVNVITRSNGYIQVEGLVNTIQLLGKGAFDLIIE